MLVDMVVDGQQFDSRYPQIVADMDVDRFDVPDLLDWELVLDTSFVRLEEGATPRVCGLAPPR